MEDKHSHQCTEEEEKGSMLNLKRRKGSGRVRKKTRKMERTRWENLNGRVEGE